MPFINEDEIDSITNRGNFNIFSNNLNTKSSKEKNNDLMYSLNQLHSDEELENTESIDCKYMTIDDINKLDQCNVKHSILHFNILHYLIILMN